MRARIGRLPLLLIAAAGVLLNGFVHFYLYFRGGYRGIAPDELLGLTISRSFALNAVAAVLLAEVLVLATRVPKLEYIAVLSAIAFSVATLGAYLLVRTNGLLGFTEEGTTTWAVVARVAELLAIGAGVAVLTPRPGYAAARAAC